MKSLTTVIRPAGVAALVLVLSGASLHAQMGGMENKPVSKGMMMQMKPMMAKWPKASRDAVEFMTKKYGAPMHMNEHMAMWGGTGPWKRTVVYNFEVQHDFPMAHTDVMQQWVDYQVPVDRYDDLAMYDGSVVVERTNGEMSARCDKEAANFLAINLADEIAMGKRTFEDARRMYGAQIMAMKAGQPAPYTMRLLFTPKTAGAADPDRPLD